VKVKRVRKTGGEQDRVVTHMGEILKFSSGQGGGGKVQEWEVVGEERGIRTKKKFLPGKYAFLSGGQVSVKGFQKYFGKGTRARDRIRGVKMNK